jgi:ribosome biogenesis GTPase A
MAKSLRLIEENLKLVDIVLYVLDARIPRSSFNPAFNQLNLLQSNAKPVVYILNKDDLADPAATAAWVKEFSRTGAAVKLSAVAAGSAKGLPALCRRILREKLDRYARKGVTYSLKAMIIGVPNCGKSALINNLTRSASAKVGNLPGVTRGKQWLRAGDIDLLDTPGVLWSDLKDQETARRLAYAGCIKDDVLDTAQLAKSLLGELFANGYGAGVLKRYGVSGHFSLSEPITDCPSKENSRLQAEKSVGEQSAGKACRADEDNAQCTMHNAQLKVGGLLSGHHTQMPDEKIPDNTSQFSILNSQFPNPEALFDFIAKKRGCIGAGGILDAQRCATVILDDFRAGRFGKITLEKTILMA